MNPRYKLEYFKDAEWEPVWISEAEALARKIWDTQYRPAARETPLKVSNANAT